MAEVPWLWQMLHWCHSKLGTQNPEVCFAVVLLPLASMELDEASLACRDEGAGEPVTTGREARPGKLLLEITCYASVT